MSDILNLPQPYQTRRWLVALVAMVAAALLAVAVGSAFIWTHWNHKGPLAPSGGMYFFQRVELQVPIFRQNDPAWATDQLGPTEDTIASHGCAVSSAAMVLEYYGIDTDPQRLNAFLKTVDGYTPQGWIYWEKAAEVAPDRVRHAYEDLPSYWLIDSNLARGNPVIVRLKMPHGSNHFVVIAGKDGFDYLTRDPGAGATKGLYPLRELGSKIEALRFYETLEPAKAEEHHPRAASLAGKAP